MLCIHKGTTMNDLHTAAQSTALPVAAAVSHSLRRSDPRAARTALEHALSTGTPVYDLVPAYACCLAAYTSTPEHDALLRTVRHQIRDELIRLPVSAKSVWVIPTDRSPVTATAAHITSLREVARGRCARVWLWDTAPASGDRILVGRDVGTADIMADTSLFHNFPAAAAAGA